MTDKEDNNIISLSDSNICRLCASINNTGSSIYASTSTNTNTGTGIVNDSITSSTFTLSSLINSYLPLEVKEDDGLPKTICPGCNIQLEATAQFMDLVIDGQNSLRNLLKAQNDTNKKALKEADAGPEETEIIVQILENGTLYCTTHPLTLRLQGLDKPKRKRGRPPKTPKPPTPIPQEPEPLVESENLNGKRKRKVPKRFEEIVQGKELDRIFFEEGVIDGNEMSEDEIEANINKNDEPESVWGGEIIGHMESNDGTDLGQLIVVNSGKTRGRQKGSSRGSRQTCNICSIQFTSSGRYMAHVAAHHAQDLKTIERPQEISISKENMPNIEYVEDQLIENAEKMIKEDFALEPIQPVECEKIVEITDETESPKDETEPPASIIELDSTEGLKYKCTKCDKVFNSKKSSSVHLKVAHPDKKPYSCEYCDATFAYRISAKHHMNIHFPKGDKGYACDLCGKILNHPSSVVYHKETEHNNGRRYICNKCGRSFKHSQLLKRHQLVHTENRPYSCKLCQNTFKTRANLVNHMPTHSGVKKFSCELCQQKFTHKASLIMHMRSHAGIKPYKCDKCEKAFAQSGNLTEHMRIHTGEKPYSCTTCHKKFTTSSQQRIHVQRHLGEKPYQCPECDKRFMHKDAWRCHMRRHKGEKPHSCHICSRSFIERWALRKHLRIHSGERPFSCNVCGRAFTDCSNLTKHKKIHRDENVHKESAYIPGGTMESEDSQVVYITYPSVQVEDDDDIPTFHMINSDTSMKDFSTCLYDTSGRILTENSISKGDTRETEKKQSENQITTTIIDQVLDQAGNPLHLTMEDGTQLAITSSDGGKSLQVTTEDGQTIPVQFETKESDILLKDDNIILDHEIVESAAEELIQPIKVDSLNRQTVRLLTTLDDPNLSQYFTFSES